MEHFIQVKEHIVKFLLNKIAVFVLSTFGILSGPISSVSALNKQNIPDKVELKSSRFFVDDRNEFLETLTTSSSEYEYYLNKEVTFDYEGYDDTLTNDSEFLSRGRKTYEGINGEDTTVDMFYYPAWGLYNHPNVGLGLMLYKAIQYKLANPEEENEVYITSFHYSIIAGVNLVESSPYYGTMKSMPDEPLDNDGYVRFSYLTLFAAKIGIHVYAVYQTTGYSDYGVERDPHAYYLSHLEDDCSSKHGLGSHKVKEFLHPYHNEWEVYGDKGATDMYHLKCLIAKHYLDKNGVVHNNSSFLSSSNLDGVLKNGAAGHPFAQTGQIISDHEYIYRTLKNFILFTTSYCGQDDGILYRTDFVREIKRQKEIIKTSGYESIKDEMMIYLGTPEDDVFELYLTPFDETFTTWTDANPYCKYVEKMVNSKKAIRCYWTNPKFSYDFDFLHTFCTKLARAYKMPRPYSENIKNVLYVRSPYPAHPALQELEEGKHLGFKKIVEGNYNHQKDILLEYEDGGIMHSTMILNTANLHLGGLHYQINSVLIMKETENDGMEMGLCLKKCYDTYEV